MSSNLRTIALIFIVSPFAAMFSEPFFEAIFDQLGWDTETWVVPVMAVLDGLSGLWPFAVGAALFGLGVWSHYFAQRFTTASPLTTLNVKAAWGDKTKIAGFDGPANADGSAADGHHLIPKPESFFKISSKRTQDGHDLVVSFYTRNRSKIPLFIDPTFPRNLMLENGVSANNGGGGSTPYAPNSEQRTMAGHLTCYNDIKGLKGTAIASICFGEKARLFSTKLILEVDFSIESQIEKVGGSGDLAVSIIEDRTRYEAIED